MLSSVSIYWVVSKWLDSCNSKFFIGTSPITCFAAWNIGENSERFGKTSILSFFINIQASNLEAKMVWTELHPFFIMRLQRVLLVQTFSEDVQNRKTYPIAYPSNPFCFLEAFSFFSFLAGVEVTVSVLSFATGRIQRSSFSSLISIIWQM